MNTVSRNIVIFLLFSLSVCGALASEALPAIKVGQVALLVRPTPPDEFPSDQAWNTVRNEVNGIGIGDTKNKVIDRFGKPLSVKKGGVNDCGGSKTILRYSGISFTLDENDERNKIVVLIEITSTKWEMAPGAKIEDSIKDVRGKMRSSGDLSTDRGQKVLTYGDGDGYINFYFRKGRLVRIVRILNMC